MSCRKLLQRRIARWVKLALISAGALWLLFILGRFWSAHECCWPGTSDFLAYWSSSRLLRQGQNPYDPRALWQIEQAHGWPEPLPLKIWTPPWTLVLLIPLSILPFGPSHLIWLVLQLVLILGSSVLLWRYFVPSDTRYWIALLFAFGFFPAIASLIMGQMGAWLLAGVVGFLCAVRGRRDLAAGGALFLLLVKPHVSYLFWPAALWWAFRERRLSILVGWGAALAMMSGVAMVLSPQVFIDFVGSALEAPIVWRTPTIGTVLRQIFGWKRQWLPFLPPLLGVLGLAIWMWRWRGAWRWKRIANPLLLASIITTPFGWSHDQLVLLPTVIALIGRVLPIENAGQSAILAVWVACQIGSALVFQHAVTFHRIGVSYLVWYAPTLAGLYVWSGWLYARRTSDETVLNATQNTGASS